jgi:Phage gp6-like head-tail connector protein
MPLQITFKGNELSDFLKIEPGYDDGPINTMLESAKSEAETFLNTDFSTEVIAEDGTVTKTTNEAPATVKEWVLNRVIQKYENRGNFMGQFAAKNPLTPDFSTLQPYRVYPFKG